MTLCINDSGTYRNITTLCINNSGTYRNITTGCINQSGTYRLFLLQLGVSFGGGFLICKQSPNVRWVVSPYSTEVSRNWYNQNDASTCAQQVTGCTGWFVPTSSQLQNPGYICRSFWGPSPCYSQISPRSACYWSSTASHLNDAVFVCFESGNANGHLGKCRYGCVRAFRCVSY